MHGPINLRFTNTNIRPKYSNYLTSFPLLYAQNRPLPITFRSLLPVIYGILNPHLQEARQGITLEHAEPSNFLFSWATVVSLTTPHFLFLFLPLLVCHFPSPAVLHVKWICVEARSCSNSLPSSPSLLPLRAVPTYIYISHSGLAHSISLSLSLSRSLSLSERREQRAMEIFTGSENSLCYRYRLWPSRSFQFTACSGHMITASYGDSLLLSEAVSQSVMRAPTTAM